MMENLFKNKYRVASTRLKEWDYTQSGYYFVTICVKNRECAFGRLEHDKMILSDVGKITKKYLQEIPDHFPFVKLDACTIMPNHIHGIIVIDNKDDPGCRDVARNVSTTQFSRISPKYGSLSSVIRSFKSAVTKTINKQYPDKAFSWQSRFYDRIIRDERELRNVRNYIQNNPLKWEGDEENPDVKR